jgi:hypothetical protein
MTVEITDLGWKPIESAPKDGTQVLLCRATDAEGKPIGANSFGLFTQVAAWWEGEDEWIVYCDLCRDPALHFEPSHWMHVPRNPLS